MGTVEDVRNREATPSHASAIASLVSSAVQLAKMEVIQASVNGVVWENPFFVPSENPRPALAVEDRALLPDGRG